MPPNAIISYKFHRMCRLDNRFILCLFFIYVFYQNQSFTQPRRNNQLSESLFNCPVVCDNYSTAIFRDLVLQETLRLLTYSLTSSFANHGYLTTIQIIALICPCPVLPCLSPSTHRAILFVVVLHWYRFQSSQLPSPRLSGRDTADSLTRLGPPSWYF